jgi:hypothetical protein
MRAISFVIDAAKGVVAANPPARRRGTAAFQVARPGTDVGGACGAPSIFARELP